VSKDARKKVVIKAVRGRPGVYRYGPTWDGSKWVGGRFFAAVEFPRTADGARVKRWTEKFGTIAQAEAERDRLRNEIRNGIDVPVEKITAGALLDKFLKSRTAVSPTTAARYSGLVDRVRPYIGGKPAGKMRAADFVGLYSELQTKCRICSNVSPERPARDHKCVKPLSSTSVRHIHNLLHGAFAWAVRMNVLSRSPLDALAQDAPQRRRPQVDAYSDQEVVALLEAARGSRWEASLKFALATGCRRGEVAALRWDDVRLETDAQGNERGAVTICRSFAQVGRVITTKGTKTGATRTIPCNALALEALAISRFQASQDAFRAEDGYEPSGYVFTTVLGHSIAPRDLTLAFEVLRKAAGVKKRLHDARHWAASQMLGAGVDIVTASRLLGHAAPSVTLNVYSHAIEGLAEDAVGRLDVRLRAAIERAKAAEK
jgi:integrase